MRKTPVLDDFYRLQALETDECIVWPYMKNWGGYAIVSVNKKPLLAHRLSLVLATGVNRKGMDAAHGPCHNRACINPRHLRWATRSENLLDMRRDGTVPDRRGERAPVARLTDEQVLEIRASKEPVRALAVRYEVCRSTIYNVLHRTTWDHL